jgi:hypothetical protein
MAPSKKARALGFDHLALEVGAKAIKELVDRGMAPE